MRHIPILLVVTTSILGAFLAITFFQETEVNADTKNKVKIYEKDGFRVVESNGIPDHETGKFPNPRKSESHQRAEIQLQNPAKSDSFARRISYAGTAAARS